MGWYDAFKSNVKPQAHSAITTDAGSAAKNFGDAFVDIGKSMREVQNERKKDELTNADIEAAHARTALSTTQNTQAGLDNEYTNSQRDISKFDDAFKKDFTATNDIDYQKSLLEFEKDDGVFESNVSNSAFEYAKAKIVADEKEAQKLFNDEAVKLSVTGGYKDYKSFQTANTDVVKNSDATTTKAIEKYFSEKDTKIKDIKVQQTLLSKDKQIVALTASKANTGFKYSEKTDAKIAAQVKTAMGMDSPDYSFSDKTKKIYENSVSGAAKISKQYNLEPSLAIHVYQNPDLYDFTVDNKITRKKVKKEDRLRLRLKH